MNYDEAQDLLSAHPDALFRVEFSDTEEEVSQTVFYLKGCIMRGFILPNDTIKSLEIW